MSIYSLYLISEFNHFQSNDDESVTQFYILLCSTKRRFSYRLPPRHSHLHFATVIHAIFVFTLHMGIVYGCGIICHIKTNTLPDIKTINYVKGSVSDH
jgi:hypothetical protein